MHQSLDGFLAGLNGEMNWIKVDEEIFDHVGKRSHFIPPPLDNLECSIVRPPPAGDIVQFHFRKA